MTDLPEVKLKALVNFPVSADGRTGITVVKDGGRFFLDLDYADFQITPNVSVDDMPNSYNLIWDEVKQTFAKVPFALQATSGVSSIEGQTGALDLDTTLAFTGSTLGVTAGSRVASLGGQTGVITLDATLLMTGSSLGTAGGWFNTRLAKTAAYPVVNADKGSTIALGGAAFYTLTFNAASGYDANFAVMVVNEDTGRGKTIALNGLTNFILWPGQSCFVYNQNNVWKVTERGRWRLPGSLTLNVDHTNGLSTSDGLGTGSGALPLIQTAISIIQEQFDCNAGLVTILLPTETFTENDVTAYQPLVGQNSFVIWGNGKANTIWQCGAGHSCLNAKDGGLVAVDKLKMLSTGSGSVGIVCGTMSVIDFAATGDFEFGAFAGGFCWQVIGSGTLNATGNYTVSGNFGVFGLIAGLGTLVHGGVTVNLPNALTFTDWYQMNGGFVNSALTTYTGTGAGAGSTGRKYNIALNAVLASGGSTFPGATAGVTATGAQFS